MFASIAVTCFYLRIAISIPSPIDGLINRFGFSSQSQMPVCLASHTYIPTRCYIGTTYLYTSPNNRNNQSNNKLTSSPNREAITEITMSTLTYLKRRNITHLTTVVKKYLLVLKYIRLCTTEMSKPRSLVAKTE